MRVFKLKRETKEGQFSLENWQLFVGLISDPHGKIFKGMSILGAHGMFEFPFIVSKDDAILLVSSIDSTLDMQLPVKFSIKTGSHFLSFNLHFKKHIEKWHGGGGFKGVISLTSFGVLGTFISATISKETLISLRKCLIIFYDLSEPGV